MEGGLPFHRNETYQLLPRDDQAAARQAAILASNPPHATSADSCIDPRQKFFYMNKTDSVIFSGTTEQEGNTDYARIENASSFKFKADCGNQYAGLYTIRWRMSVRKNFVIPNGLHFAVNVIYKAEPADTSGSMEVVMTRESLLEMFDKQALSSIQEQAPDAQAQIPNANFQVSAAQDQTQATQGQTPTSQRQVSGSIQAHASTTGDGGYGLGDADSDRTRSSIVMQQQQTSSLSWCDVELKETLVIHPHLGAVRIELVLSNIKDLESRESVKLSGLAVHHAMITPKAEITHPSTGVICVPVHQVLRSREPDYVAIVPRSLDNSPRPADPPPILDIIRIACSTDGRFLAALALSKDAIYLRVIDWINCNYAIEKLNDLTDSAIGLSISANGDHIAVYQEPSIGAWTANSKIPLQSFPFKLFGHSLSVTKSGSVSTSDSADVSTRAASPPGVGTSSTNDLRYLDKGLNIATEQELGGYLEEFVGYGAFLTDTGDRKWELSDFNLIPVDEDEGSSHTNHPAPDLAKTMFVGCDGLCLYVFDVPKRSTGSWQHKYTVMLDKLTPTLSQRITCKMMMGMISSNTFTWLEAGGAACTIWNLQTGSNITHITSTSKAKFGGRSFRNNSKVAISPDESIVALMSVDGTLTTFFTTTGIAISECNFPGYKIEYLGFTQVEELLVVLRHNASFALETRVLDPLQLKSQTICFEVHHKKHIQVTTQDSATLAIQETVCVAQEHPSTESLSGQILGSSSASSSITSQSQTKDKVAIQPPVPTAGTIILGSLYDKKYGKSRPTIFEASGSVINCHFLVPPNTSLTVQDPNNAENAVPGLSNPNSVSLVQPNPQQAALSQINSHPNSASSPCNPAISEFIYTVPVPESEPKDDNQENRAIYELKHGTERRELVPDGEGAQYWVPCVEVWEGNTNKEQPPRRVFSFVPEPWMHTLTTDVADSKALLDMTFFGDHGRFAVLGQQSIQIWTVPTSDSNCNLLYIWSRPDKKSDLGGTDDGDIEEQYDEQQMTIHRREDGGFSVWQTKPAKFLIDIPEQLDNGNKSAFRDCLDSIHLLAAAYAFSHHELKKTAKNSEAALILENHTAAIVRFTLEHINRVRIGTSTGRTSQTAVDSLLTVLLDDVPHRSLSNNIFVEGLIESANGKWIPRTCRALNPLRRVSDARNGQLLGTFIKYCINNAKTRHPAYMTPIVQCMKELSERYPNVLRDIFKEASYIPVHNQDYVIAHAKIVNRIYKPWLSRSWLAKSNNINDYKKPIFCLLSQLKVKTAKPKNIFFPISQAARPVIGTFLSSQTNVKPETRMAEKPKAGWCCIPWSSKRRPVKDSKMAKELKTAKYSHTIYVSPFPKFSSYGRRKTSSSRVLCLLSGKDWDPVESPFISLAGKDFFESPAMEAILTFKWEKFGFLTWSIQFLVSFFLFTTIVTLTGIQIYLCTPPTPTHPSTDEELRARYMQDKIHLFWLVIALAAFILLFDLLRACSAPFKYIKSPYWVIRMVANGLTVIGFAMFTTKHVGDLDEITHTDRGPSQISWISFAILAYYLNFLFELRAVESLGTVVNIMIKIAKSIVWFAIVFILFLIGFTHALLHLLHTRKYDNCNNDDPTRPCAPEDFPDTYPSRFFPALSSTYFFLAGRYDPVSDALDSVVPSVHVMMCIFYTFTAILFLNILIAVMNDTFNDTKKQGQIARLEQWSEIIAEAESIFLVNSQLMNNSYFPDYVFYGDNERDAERHQSVYSISHECDPSVENRLIVDTASKDYNTGHTTPCRVMQNVQELEATVSDLEVKMDSQISQLRKEMSYLKSDMGGRLESMEE